MKVEEDLVILSKMIQKINICEALIKHLSAKL